MQKKFKRDVNSLESIYKFITEFVARNKLDAALIFSINLVLEELFINMVKYHPENPNEILIELAKYPDKIAVTLTDFDVDHFDIGQVEEYDRTQSLNDRPVGGLGIHLVKKIADRIDYEYKNRTSKIKLTIRY